MMAGGQSNRKRKVEKKKGGEESGEGRIGKKKKVVREREQAPVQEKRLSSFGKVVRWSATPSAKLKDRIQRAKPGW